MTKLKPRIEQTPYKYTDHCGIVPQHTQLSKVLWLEMGGFALHRLWQCAVHITLHQPLPTAFPWCHDSSLHLLFYGRYHMNLLFVVVEQDTSVLVFKIMIIACCKCSVFQLQC